MERSVDSVAHEIEVETEVDEKTEINRAVNPKEWGIPVGVYPEKPNLPCEGWVRIGSEKRKEGKGREAAGDRSSCEGWQSGRLGLGRKARASKGDTTIIKIKRMATTPSQRRITVERGSMASKRVEAPRWAG